VAICNNEAHQTIAKTKSEWNSTHKWFNVLSLATAATPRKITKTYYNWLAGGSVSFCKNNLNVSMRYNKQQRTIRTNNSASGRNNNCNNQFRFKAGPTCAIHFPSAQALLGSPSPSPESRSQRSGDLAMPTIPPIPPPLHLHPNPSNLSVSMQCIVSVARSFN